MNELLNTWTEKIPDANISISNIDTFHDLRFYYILLNIIRIIVTTKLAIIVVDTTKISSR